MRNIGNCQHQHNTHEDAGEITGHEHIQNRIFRNGSVQNQHNSRGDHGGNQCGRRRDCRGKCTVKTTLLHLRNQHLGLHRTICVGRTGTSAHQHTKYYVYLCQTAFHMTGQHFREIHHLVTDAAVVHDGTSHNEKWNR